VSGHDDSIWTRERKLNEEEKLLLIEIRRTFKGLATELDNDDWRASATSADLLITQCIRQDEIERELGNITPMIEAFDRIGERMEKLEAEARQHGWKAHD
jgi:hypothetical protein